MLIYSAFIWVTAVSRAKLPLSAIIKPNINML